MTMKMAKHKKYGLMRSKSLTNNNTTTKMKNGPKKTIIWKRRILKINKINKKNHSNLINRTSPFLIKSISKEKIMNSQMIKSNSSMFWFLKIIKISKSKASILKNMTKMVSLFLRSINMKNFSLQEIKVSLTPLNMFLKNQLRFMILILSQAKSLVIWRKFKMHWTLTVKKVSMNN